MTEPIRHLGRYELLRRIAVGGMGEVWEASHAFLARPAAIKLVRPALLGLEPLTDAPDAARSSPQAVLVALAGGGAVGLGTQLAGGGIGPLPSTFLGMGAAVALLLLTHFLLLRTRRTA